MTRDQQLSEIRAACIEALCARGTRSEQARYKASFDRKIGIADILLAIQNIERPFSVAMSNVWWNKQERKTIDLWNLPKDDITLQSDECVAFIWSVLQPTR